MSDAIAKGEKAKTLLDNEIFKAAFDGVRLAIIDRIERCKMEDTGTAEELRKCLRLLKDVRSQVEAFVADGKIVQFRLEREAEDKQKRKIGLIPNFFR